MKIRPKIPMFQKGGLPSTVTWTDPNSTWFTRSGDFGILEGTYNYLKPLYDKWKSSGKLEDYLAYKKAVDTLNSNLRYGYAPKHLQYLSGNNLLYRDNNVGAWQTYVRDNYKFINDSIGNNFSKYKIHSSNPYSGDNLGKEWKVDNLWAGITDDRTTWGNLLNPNDPNYQKWKQKFSEIGIDYRTNPEWNTGDVLYGFLKEENLNPPSLNNFPFLTVQQDKESSTDIPADGGKKYGFDWNKIKEVGAKIFGNPDLYGIGRLAGNLNNNNRVYDEALKAIRPVLRLTYNTHRQVVGDEATKQAYYRRAVLGQTKAARPFTSDADRLMAYQFEAKRVGDELRALGDLADNQEIRRTSDESNQHEWANTQRATEIANANIASLNQTNAAKHNLLALKHSALWSSIDNYLKELEYRKRQQLSEKEALDDQIYALTRASEIENDSELLDLLEQLEAAFKKPENLKDSYGQKIVDRNSKEIKDLVNQINQRKRLLLIETYQLRYNRKYNNNLNFLKSGSKVTYKKKDDLLYKSAKDVVEHFRKMSKMSSDALNRKTPKIEKLTSYPKGKTRKYQLGGLAPFTVYTPVAMGGETSRSSEYGSSSKASSSKNNEGKETLDLVKSLFEKVLGKGLPIDVNSIYAQMSNLFSLYKAFGKELDTDDIAMLYLQSMQSLNNVIYSKEVYNKAKELATQNEALDEFAVNVLGHFVVQDTETGKLSTEKSWKDVLESGKNPITNAQLLLMRAYNPELSSQRGDELIERVVNNGMGINKIGAQIKALAGNIGSYEGKIEGLTQVESNKVKSGLLLLVNAPDGYYKHTVEDKNQETQMKAAVAYITNMLSPSQRAILDAHGGADKLIPMFLASQENITHNVSFLPLTGKTANAKGKNNNGDGDMLPSVAFFNGLGEKDTFVILDKTSDGLKINTISTPITSKGHNTGSITLNKLESSDFGGLLIINLATMGDSLISSMGRNNIIIDGRIYQAELPIDQEAKRNTGIIKPDLKFLKNIEKADSVIKQKGLDKSNPKDIPAINKIYQDNNLPILYTISNNKPTITSDYARFAIVNGIGTEDAFGEKPEFNDGVLEISSDKERQLFESMMLQQGNSKYKLDNGVGIGSWTWGETKLYKGTIYIPMTTSNISALAGTGFKAKGEEYNLIEARQQAADAARNKGFVPAGDASNFK